MVAPGSTAALGEGKGEAVTPEPVEVDPVDHSALSVVDPAWELLDPTPDLRVLLLQLNARFFGLAGRRAGAMEPKHDTERRAVPLPELVRRPLAVHHPA